MDIEKELTHKGSRQEKAPLSLELIIETSLELLQGSDPEQVSLRDISAALDTGPASLYAYVKSRDDLLLQSLDAVLSTVDC